MMIDRIAREVVRRDLDVFPGVVLLGPRQVGKTTLARSIVDATEHATYVDLRDPDSRVLIESPRPWLDDRPGLVVLDEVQEVPELFATLRGLIDDHRRLGRLNGQLLLLGSASDRLLRQSTESLAGRVSYRELTPLLVEEVGGGRHDVDRLWLRGGFPESWLALDDVTSAHVRTHLVRSYLERDIPHFAPRIPATTLERYWTMLAHRQGAPFNASELARSIDASAQSATRYLDLLVDLMLVRRLPAWHANVGKQLVKSPRTYVRDSGVLHQRLGIRTADELLSHPVVGASWEGFVIEQLVAAMADAGSAWYYRTRSGAEIDLLLDMQGVGRWAIEIKRSRAPRVSRGFHVACGDVEATRRIVVHSGEHRIGLADGIEALPLRDAIGVVRTATA